MKEARGKAPLMLMEQVVMILVFAVAAALCVQAFVTASLMAESSEKEDHGAGIAQTVAETIKEEHGDLAQVAEQLDGEYQDGKLSFYYDKNWNLIPGEEEAVYEASAKMTVPGEYFSQGEVKITDIQENQEIFFLKIGWQEVVEDE